MRHYAAFSGDGPTSQTPRSPLSPIFRDRAPLRTEAGWTPCISTLPANSQTFNCASPPKVLYYAPFNLARKSGRNFSQLG